MLGRIFLALALLFSPLYGTISVSPEKHPALLLIDTDCNLSDLIEIEFLIKNPRVEVKGITTSGLGMTHWETGAYNILNLLELLGHPRIPVALGARESLSPVGSYPDSWRESADTVLGIQLPTNSVRPISLKGEEFILETLLKAHTKIEIISSGPLTTIALALEKKPEIKSKIERLFIVGGTLVVPGNIEDKALGFKNKVAEYSIFLDAKAAEMIFESGIPITLLPLDVLDQIPSQPFYEMLENNRQTPAANFAYELLKPSHVNKKKGRELLYSPAAAAILTDPTLATIRDLKLMVYSRKGPEYGKLMMSSKGHTVSVVTQIQSQKFYDLLLETLNRKPNLHANHIQTP